MKRIADFARGLVAAAIFIALVILAIAIGYQGTKSVLTFLWGMIG